MSSSSGSRGLLPNGKISELFRYNSATVIQMSYDDENKNWLKAQGYFMVTLIIQMTYSILMTVCAVDDFKWPLTKDSVVIRLAERSFAIALPGLFYGLRLPLSCKETIINSLVRVFIKYGHYLDLKSMWNAYPVLDNEPNFWQEMLPRIQPIAHDNLRKFGYMPGRSRYCILDEESSSVRAVRMSGTTKLIENAVSLGKFNNSHIVISPEKQIDASRNRSNSNTAFASLTVFTYIVDTVEISWIMSRGFSHLLNQMLPPLHSWPYPGLKVWRLNDRGLGTILRELGTTPEQEEEVVVEKERVKERKTASVSASDKGKQPILID